MEEKRLGVYIHIPFCASKCAYCDFYSLAGNDELMDEYQAALETHIRDSAEMMSSYYVDSVYFGGGTPSFFGAERICSILDTLKSSAQVLRSAEITVECNPDSVTKRALKMLRSAGVNRLSIGMQSANPEILKLIGRRHTYKQVKLAMKCAREAGFENVSLDVIYGLPSQTKSDWADTLNKCMALKPEHISCYGLKLEEGTPLCMQYADSPIMPSDDEQADMYLYALETLESYGFPQYEISNFALPGHESRHNLKYWDMEDYAGFGCAAHSYVNGLRYSFVRDIHAYINGIVSETDIIDEYEKIERFDRAAEYIMLAMRRKSGISKEEYRAVYRGNFAPLEVKLQEFRRKGWVEQEGDRWHFTGTGFLLSNLLIGALLEAQAEERSTEVAPWMKETFEQVVEPTELPPGDDVFLRSRSV